jgi:Na+-transporting NADH:ubiquinone oxidoreductase subunit F
MAPIVVSSIIVFVLIIFLLTFLILTAKDRLLPQTDVAIVINGNAETPVVVKPGSTLLTTLASLIILLLYGLWVVL